MIALLTDFGLDDIYVGVMKSVILAIDPGAQIVDISHAVPAHDIETGAFLLASSWPYLPAGSGVAGVVDPGVGSQRRLIGIAIDARWFIGPDNGLASMIVAEHKIAQAVTLDRRRYHLPNRVGETFHGRDIIAPVAAYLNAGAALADVGTPIDPNSLARLRIASASFGEHEIIATVRLVDRFGNLILDLKSASFQIWMAGATSALVSLNGGWSGRASVGDAYASGTNEEPVLIPDSYGRIEIALRNSNAADRLGGIAIGAKVSIKR